MNQKKEKEQLDSTLNFTRKEKSLSPSDKLLSAYSMLALNKKANRKPRVFCNPLNHSPLQCLKVSI